MNFIILSAFFISLNSFANTWIFDCDKSLNVPRRIEIEPNFSNGDGYELKANYTTSGADPVTGTLVAVRKKMIGQTDRIRYRGRVKVIIALTEVNRPHFQLEINFTKKVGASVEAVEIDLSKNFERKFRCQLRQYEEMNL